jgi:transcriptional regulator with XRE-family HTH domain
VEDDTEPGVISQRLAANLKAAREAAGLSQEAVAQGMRDAGYRFYQQTIGKIEAGDRTVSAEELFALASVIGSSVYMLARPAGHTAEALRILSAARQVRRARDEARAVAIAADRKHGDAVAALKRAIARAREDGLEEALAEEIRTGERTLAGSQKGEVSD